MPRPPTSTLFPYSTLFRSYKVPKLSVAFDKVALSTAWNQIRNTVHAALGEWHDMVDVFGRGATVGANAALHDQSQRAPISAAAISLKLAHLIPKICRTTRSAPARCATIGCLRSPNLVTVRGVIFRVPPVRVPAPEFLIYVSKIIGILGPPVRQVF